MTKRRKPRDLEGELSEEFNRTVIGMSFLLKFPQHFCMYHIANEDKNYEKNEHIRISIGAKLKRQGKLAGVFDYFVSWFDGERMQFAYLEAKIGYNKLSDTQKEFKARLDLCGIPNVTFWKVNEGIDFLIGLGIYKISLDDFGKTTLR